MLRHQLPAYSPIPPAAVLAAAGALLRPNGSSPREALSERLRRHFHAGDMLLCDSGTSALRLAMSGALEVGQGRPVVLPAYCCYDVATAAVGAGAAVRFYDLEPETLGPDRVSLQAAVAGGAAAVVVAHLYGMPVDVAAVQQVVGRGVLVVEDAAQGFGGSLEGRPLGSLGSVAVLSFGRGKGVAGGGGGALLALDDVGAAVLEGLRALPVRWRAGVRSVAALAGQWVFGRPALYELPAALPFLRLGQTVYREPWPPRAIPAACAAAAVRAWAASEAEARGRRSRAERLLEAVKRASDLRAVRPPTGAEPGYLRLPAIASPEAVRRSGSAARLGIMPGYPRALPDLPVFGDERGGGTGFPGARLLAARLLTLPTHGRLSERDLAALERWIG